MVASVFASLLATGNRNTTNVNSIDGLWPDDTNNDILDAIKKNPIAAEDRKTTAENTAITQQYQSAASQLTAEGDDQEAALYGTAGDIAHNNALLALSAGDIEQAKTQLEMAKTIGGQRADFASSGFGSSGSALSLFRASKQQGLLEQQLDVTNAQTKAGGAYAQEAAARAEAGRASSAANVARVTGEAASVLASRNQTTATNEAALIAQVASIGPIDPHTGQPTLAMPDFVSQNMPKYNAQTGKLEQPAPMQTIYDTTTGQPQQVQADTFPKALPSVQDILKQTGAQT